MIIAKLLITILMMDIVVLISTDQDLKNLLRDMKNEKINCIIVKDLSRFARSHIEADMYFENTFPALNIRFISIRENIDSIIIFQNGEINVKFK